MVNLFDLLHILPESSGGKIGVVSGEASRHILAIRLKCVKLEQASVAKIDVQKLNIRFFGT